MARNKKRLTIVFLKDFYKLKAIKSTIRDYNYLANFKIVENKKEIKVMMTNIDRKVQDIIKNEFCNYVLAEMKNG